VAGDVPREPSVIRPAVESDSLSVLSHVTVLGIAP
jgi:hypothetical protein